MYLKSRGLPPAMLVAGVVAMCDAIRRRAQALDPALVVLGDELDALARAALLARDPRALGAYCRLVDPAVTVVEQALAAALAARRDENADGAAEVGRALLELGWTQDDLEALARSAAAKPGVAAPVGTDVTALVEADEAEILARDAAGRQKELSANP